MQNDVIKFIKNKKRNLVKACMKTCCHEITTLLDYDLIHTVPYTEHCIKYVPAYVTSSDKPYTGINNNNLRFLIIIKVCEQNVVLYSFFQGLGSLKIFWNDLHRQGSTSLMLSRGIFYCFSVACSLFFGYHGGADCFSAASGVLVGLWSILVHSRAGCPVDVATLLGLEKLL